MNYILPLAKIRTKHGTGNKARNLKLLARHGFSIPLTYVCTWDAYDRYTAGDAEVLRKLRAELRQRLDLRRRYAVRSSADMEDSPESSFAGQFRSVLNVLGEDALIDAILSVWHAARETSVQTYLHEKARTGRQPKLAVLIQEMVAPQISGVAFSKNPVTSMDEVIVEAIAGSGEALVQEGATPERWINKWGVWLAQPEPSTIDLALVEVVVKQTRAIAAARRCDVDLEWVYDGEQIQWVQLREITTMDVPVYSNRISREVLPGIIKPLIWSVNVPLVNQAWIDVLTEFIGPNDLQPEHLAGHFYYRAYFNMGTLGLIFKRLGLPKEALELLLGLDIEAPDKPSFKPTAQTYRLLPRIVIAALSKLTVGHKVKRFLESMASQYQSFRRDDLDTLTEQQLLAQIDRLQPLAELGAYYNVVTQVPGLFYNRILAKQLAKLNVDFQTFDLTGDMDAMRAFEPNWHLARLNQAFQTLEPAIRKSVRQSDYETFRQLPKLKPFQAMVARFLDDFGHLSDSGNDFSHRPWRETPDLILRMITDYKATESITVSKVKFDNVPVSGLRRLWLRMLCNRARRFALYREAVSSLYTFGYGLFRDLYLALGDHFTRRKLIAQKDDIFFLYADEVRQIVESTATKDVDYCALIEARKHDIEAVRDVATPSIIYGEEAPPLELEQKNGLRGVPTSRGYYSGPVKVLRGLQDFDKVHNGDVLVVPYSDVGWTPLFARAGAVIAESGGILSHSSIVAREYGIPAVVSVPGACQLADDTIVTVDGHHGEIIVQDSPPTPSTA